MELRNINEIQKKNLEKWNIDLSLLKDGVYDISIKAPKDIKEFKGFKEELGIEINRLEGHLSFFGCTELRSIGKLPECIDYSLLFDYCCKLTHIETFPKVVGYIFTEGCSFFDGMTQEQIRKKYGITEYK